MAEKSFVLLSLKDDKAKKLSKALGNETCRKILEYLASKGDATETQISKDLKIPISTVNYNMKLLGENGLVSMDEYHYSEKGKEVIHYKMRNRYIVIAPEAEDEKSIMSKLKGMIPAVILLGVATFVVGLFETVFKGGNSLMASKSMDATLMTATADAAGEAAPEMLMRTQEFAPIATTTSDPHVTLWFFAGGVFVLFCVLIWNFTRR